MYLPRTAEDGGAAVLICARIGIRCDAQCHSSGCWCCGHAVLGVPALAPACSSLVPAPRCKRALQEAAASLYGSSPGACLILRVRHAHLSVLESTTPRDTGGSTTERLHRHDRLVSH
ncbi:hypothetical protein AAFF_G00105680 [Aldrovandia affinis]|uniref:Uncharacterized protein n=1 Tax=Aldrovandia affinis TaxID=143900 RepID=A0AAD7T3W6_9TELE|nr:hypothetical protein AAFF_G00105680 [Aldrovandia affinis]